MWDFAFAKTFADAEGTTSQAGESRDRHHGIPVAPFALVAVRGYLLSLVGLDAVSVLGYIVPFFYGGLVLDRLVWNKSGVWASPLLYVLLPLVGLVLIGVFLRLISRPPGVVPRYYRLNSTGKGVK